MDLALGDAVAPLAGEPGGDRCQVLLQPTRESGERIETTVHGLGHPGLQVSTPVLPDHGEKRLTQPMRPCNAGIHGAEMVQIRLRLSGPCGGWAHHGERHRPG
jgi:hypothetical protein